MLEKERARQVINYDFYQRQQCSPGCNDSRLRCLLWIKTRWEFSYIFRTVRGKLRIRSWKSVSCTRFYDLRRSLNNLPQQNCSCTLMVAVSSHNFSPKLRRSIYEIQTHGSTEFWVRNDKQVIAKCTTGQDFSRSVASSEIDSVTSSEDGFDSQNLASHIIEPQEPR